MYILYYRFIFIVFVVIVILMDFSDMQECEDFVRSVVDGIEFCGELSPDSTIVLGVPDLRTMVEYSDAINYVADEISERTQRGVDVGVCSEPRWIDRMNKERRIEHIVPFDAFYNGRFHLY